MSSYLQMEGSSLFKSVGLVQEQRESLQIKESNENIYAYFSEKQVELMKNLVTKELNLKQENIIHGISAYLKQEIYPLIESKIETKLKLKEEVFQKSQTSIEFQYQQEIENLIDRKLSKTISPIQSDLDSVHSTLKILREVDSQHQNYLDVSIASMFQQINENDSHHNEKYRNLQNEFQKINMINNSKNYQDKDDIAQLKKSIKSLEELYSNINIEIRKLYSRVRCDNGREKSKEALCQLGQLLDKTPLKKTNSFVNVYSNNSNILSTYNNTNNVSISNIKNPNYQREFSNSNGFGNSYPTQSIPNQQSIGERSPQKSDNILQRIFVETNNAIDQQQPKFGDSQQPVERRLFSDLNSSAHKLTQFFGTQIPPINFANLNESLKGFSPPQYPISVSQLTSSNRLNNQDSLKGLNSYTSEKEFREPSPGKNSIPSFAAPANEDSMKFSLQNLQISNSELTLKNNRYGQSSSSSSRSKNLKLYSPSKVEPSQNSPQQFIDSPTRIKQNDSSIGSVHIQHIDQAYHVNSGQRSVSQGLGKTNSSSQHSSIYPITLNNPSSSDINKSNLSDFSKTSQQILSDYYK